MKTTENCLLPLYCEPCAQLHSLLLAVMCLLPCVLKLSAKQALCSPTGLPNISLALTSVMMLAFGLRVDIALFEVHFH